MASCGSRGLGSCYRRCDKGNGTDTLECSCTPRSLPDILLGSNSRNRMNEKFVKLSISAPLTKCPRLLAQILNLHTTRKTLLFTWIAFNSLEVISLVTL